MFRFLARELNAGGRTMKADATVMPEQDGGAR
jgi:hypothetical protein